MSESTDVGNQKESTLDIPIIDGIWLWCELSRWQWLVCSTFRSDVQKQSDCGPTYEEWLIE